MVTMMLILSGILILYISSEMLINGSVQIAERLGIPQLVIGLTIVAFGTSAPELVVSISSGLKGLGNVAIGNVIGSNIFNLCVILGLSALICPIPIKKRIIKIDAPIVLGVSVLLVLLLIDKTIGRMDAFILLLVFVAYQMFLYRGPKEISSEPKAPPSKKNNVWASIALIVAGLSGLIWGSNMFVTGAVQLATILHVSQAVIALTIVAAGTSLPELAVSVTAAAKGRSDLAVGNVIGSNIFNILSILGISGIISPLSGSDFKSYDIILLIGSAALVIPLMYMRSTLSRFDGAVLLSIYVGYLIKLCLT